MANNQLLKTLKSKLIIILALIGVMLFSAFGLMACGEETTKVTDPEYSYTDTKPSGYFSNGGFSLGTADLKLSDYPMSNVNGWTKAIDKSAKSSYVSSGSVNVTTDGWKQLASTLYDDVDYRNYLVNKGVYKLDDVKSAIKASDAHKDNAEYTPTDSEIKDYIVTNYIVPLNPGAKDSDNHVYMLNNYAINKEYGLGTAQKLTASTSISLEKGKISKISLWIKTQNVEGISLDAGANIRLTNSIKGTTQAEYRISGIKDTEWTNYVIYVKPDSEFNCSVSLVVGLGYGNGNANDASDYAEGTVYIDNVTCETVDNVVGVTFDQQDVLSFGSKQTIEAKGKTLFYDMSYVAPTDFFTAVNFAEIDNADYYDYTKSNIQLNGQYLTSKSIVGNECNVELTKDAGLLKLRLSKASYTVKIDNNVSNFVLDGNNYALISFKLRNDLRGFGSTLATLDLVDIKGDTVETRHAIATFEPNDETTTYTVLVENNFESGDLREFYFNLILGPADISSIKYNSQFASGTVELSDLLVKIGTEPSEDSQEYNYYKFYENMASANVSLYAGLNEDHTHDEENTDTYNLTYAPSNVGEIVTQPTNPLGYVGVEAGNGYVQSGSNAKVNTRSGKGQDGSYAGLINTKYLNLYKTANPDFPETEVVTALNNSGDDIQPLMIYNKTPDHYGFLGDSISVSANNEASVSVTLRVVDLAKAYVYLVDTSEESKPVMTFNSFNVVTDIIGTKGQEINGEDLQFALTVDSTMMQADGWVTIKFFISTGNQSKNFRLEIWNGSRIANAETASTGFVFVKEVNVVTSSAFTVPTRIEDSFSVPGNPLFDEKVSSFESTNGKLIAYQRVLTDLEEEFNVEHPDKAVSYLPDYVWAQNSNVVYAVFKTLDVDEVDPYLSLEDETEDESSSCAAGSDPSTFWLSFSSILLAVILLLAIIALFVKNYRRRHARSKSDAKSHYKIKSRVSTPKKEVEEEIEDDDEIEEEQEVEEIIEESVESTEEEVQPEQNLDEYVYGDVQDFGEEGEKSETEESVEENTEEKTEDSSEN